ncbi:PDZ domain-containing protein, partial [bacterium]|nr:PDZ domain-containing protein [bacterium]
MNTDSPFQQEQAKQEEQTEQSPTEVSQQEEQTEQSSTEVSQQEESSPADDSSSKRHRLPGWLSFSLSMLLSCLLGMGLGLLLTNYNGLKSIAAEYYYEFKDKSEYGCELPEEILAVIKCYRVLHQDFYRDIPPQLLLNSSINAINIACDPENRDKNKNKSKDKDKGKNRDSDSSEKASDKANKDGGKPSDPKSSESAKAPSPQPSASPEATLPTPSPSPTLTMAQFYYAYAQLAAKKMQEPSNKCIYQPLPDSLSDEHEMLLQYTKTLLKAHYDRIIDKDELCEKAINGMTIATADPYTTCLNKEETRELDESLGNEDYGGIGVAIERDVHTNQLTVIAPIEGSPSDTAGLLTGDVIVSIDGRP